jgi:hypothetical protein
MQSTPRTCPAPRNAYIWWAQRAFMMPTLKIRRNERDGLMIQSMQQSEKVSEWDVAQVYLPCIGICSATVLLFDRERDCVRIFMREFCIFSCCMAG